MANGSGQAFEVDGVLMLQCEWFAGCTNGTLKVYNHPIASLGYVPTCARCAGRAGILADLLPIELG